MKPAPGYLQSTGTGSEPTPDDLQEFQELLEKRKVDGLINDTQSASDARTEHADGTAYKSDVPVLDISEQMPSDCKSLTSWIKSLILSLNDMFAEQSDANTSSNAGSGSTDSTDSANSSAADDSQTSNESNDESNDAPQPNPRK